MPAAPEMLVVVTVAPKLLGEVVPSPTRMGKVMPKPDGHPAHVVCDITPSGVTVRFWVKLIAPQVHTTLPKVTAGLAKVVVKLPLQVEGLAASRVQVVPLVIQVGPKFAPLPIELQAPSSGPSRVSQPTRPMRLMPTAVQTWL